MNKCLTNRTNGCIFPAIFRFYHRFAGRDSAIFVPEIYGAESPGTVRYQATCDRVGIALCVFFIGAKYSKTITEEAPMERRDTHTVHPPELESRDIYDIEEEMNEIIGFMKDVIMVLSCVDENSLVINGSYYLLRECEKKMERLDDVYQEMLTRLIRNRKMEDISDV